MDAKVLKEKALGYLRENLTPGTTLYNVSYYDRTHRKAKFYIIDSDGKPVNQTYNIANALGYRRNKEGFLLTDDIDLLVYNLSYTLFPTGFTCLGERCPASDHRNGDRDHTPHQHADGGHALRSYDL
jgi:hypothetical protein